MQKQSTMVANIEILIATIIWGSTFTIVKKILLDINAITLIFYRFMLAALIVGSILMFLHKNPMRHLKQGVILGFLLFVSYVLQTLGLYVVSAASSGFITGLFVVFVPILSVMFGYEKLRLNLLIATILVCVGLWNITGGISGFKCGELLTLMSAATLALYILYADRAVKSGDIWVLNFHQFLFVAVASLISILIFKLPLHIASYQTVFGVVYLSIFASILAFIIQLRAQKIISPVACAFILSLEPVFAAIFAWVVGGEQFTIKGAFGGLLIISAIICVQIPQIKKLLKSN